MKSVGTILSNTYRLDEWKGKGATGHVYRATVIRRTPLLKKGDTVAVKIYNDWVFDDPRQVERIRRETRFGREHRCRSLVQVFSFSLERKSNRRYIVMEYVDGVTLDDWIDKHSPLNEEVIVELFNQLCFAVQCMHDMKRVHRDIKPTNIMVCDDKDGLHLKLMDFGVLKDLRLPAITESWEFLGTIRYSSPEYLLGGSYDQRTDIYSLGATLYQMLTGKEIFSDEKNKARLSARVSGVDSSSLLTEVEDKVSSWLICLARALLMHNPDDRIYSCHQILKILEGKERSAWWLLNLLAEEGRKSSRGVDMSPREVAMSPRGSGYSPERELTIIIDATQSGEDFSGYKIEGLDLSTLNLSKCKFAGTRFYDVNLDFANFQGAHLTSASFFQCSIKKANLCRAIMDKSDVRACDFTASNMDCVKMNDANLWNVDMTGVSLVGAKLRRSRIRECNLTRAVVRQGDLVGTELTRVALVNSDLTNSNLCNASLYEVILVGADLRLCRYNAGTDSTWAIGTGEVKAVPPGLLRILTGRDIGTTLNSKKISLEDWLIEHHEEFMLSALLNIPWDVTQKRFPWRLSSYIQAKVGCERWPFP